MNKKRRNKIGELIDILKNVSGELSYLLDEEIMCMINIPENLQDSEQYIAIEEAVDKLEDAIYRTEDAIELLKET